MLDEFKIQFLIALISTIIIEVIVLFILVRGLFKIKQREITNIRLLFWGIIASFSTLPYIWFLLFFVIRPYYLFMLVAETAVFLVEALIYYFGLKISIKRALFISLLCNLASFLYGLIKYILT